MPEIHSGYADINGAQLYYEMAGSGQPVVLVHATIGDCRMWDDQFDVLAARYRVLRYDMRGFGRSEPVAGQFTHHADLGDLMVHLSIEGAFLIGCSRGGGVICDVALAYPQLVRGLVMVNSVPHGYRWPDDAQYPPEWEAFQVAIEAGDLETAAKLRVQMWVVGRFREPDQVDLAIRDRIRDMSLTGLRHQVKALGEETFLEPYAAGRMGEIQVPILLIVGSVDDPDIIAANRQFAATWSRTELAVIEGAAHLPNIERPEEFNGLVLEFMSRP